MFNPFVRFMPELIDAFLLRGPIYLVSQTFRAANDIFTEDKQVLMFCQYSDLGFAQIHLQVVRADGYAAIINLEKEKHLTKVREMLEPGSPYIIFSNMMEDQESLEAVLNKNFAAKLRRYIERHTTWRIGMNISMRPKIQLIFGELFVVVKFQSQQLRVKFADIENY